MTAGAPDTPAPPGVRTRLKAWLARNWPRWKPRLRRAARKAERLLAIIGLVLIIYHVGFKLTPIVSGSMEPTLMAKDDERDQDPTDWVLASRMSLWFGRPQRWQVVAFTSDDHMTVMKRVVGLPGEKISVSSEGDLLVNGKHEPFPESCDHLRYLPAGRMHGGRQMEAEDGYIVLGDDARDSWDSRWTGPVQEDQLIGLAWLRVWPWSRIGFVNP